MPYSLKRKENLVNLIYNDGTMYNLSNFGIDVKSLPPKHNPEHTCPCHLTSALTQRASAALVAGMVASSSTSMLLLLLRRRRCWLFTAFKKVERRLLNFFFFFSSSYSDPIFPEPGKLKAAHLQVPKLNEGGSILSLKHSKAKR